MAIMEISIVPIGIGGTSLSSYVAGCLQLLKKERVKYELSAMGTNIEAPLEDLMRVAMKMHAVPFQKGAPRVLTTIRIDDRRDKKGTLTAKKRAVMTKMSGGKGRGKA